MTKLIFVFFPFNLFHRFDSSAAGTGTFEGSEIWERILEIITRGGSKWEIRLQFYI
jgi:hypothetical protein